MRVERLRLQHFRAFDQAELEFGGGLNLISGDNGAGKTTILEAVHLLAYGRSFRGAVRESLIQRGAPSLSVYAEVSALDGQSVRIGLERGPRDWRARVDGNAVDVLSELYSRLAAVSFEPGSHDLIAGGSELRRRYLDWALFHVEPGFLPNWRRYQRALRQRNALLKYQRADDSSLSAWEQELSEAGELLTLQRATFLDRLRRPLCGYAARLLPELGLVEVHYQRGWGADIPRLSDALLAQRSRDLSAGHTSVGPHRADWRLVFDRAPERAMLSRGQEKLTALACLLAQAALLADAKSDWPVVCLDDLASELDLQHLRMVLACVADSGAQTLLTAIDPAPILANWGGPSNRFHVEQGRIGRLL